MLLYFAWLLVLMQCSSTPALGRLKDDVPVEVNQPTRKTKDAYVTLLYGGFLLGARVLGQSLRDTGTEKDFIALCTETVSEETKDVLKADGWMIRNINSIQNPYKDSSTRGKYFFGVYSKLYVWNMTDYERIVYLDSDTLVLSNIDHMFDCGTFCAAHRHSDLFNTGVLVVEPSSAIFKDMVKKIDLLPSYGHDDQGFLNVYFKDLVYATLFNWSNTSRQHQPMRLPAGLNADIGMYYRLKSWKIPPDELRVIHYTLGPLKPWIWWSSWLFDLDQLWIDVRLELPDNYNGLFHLIFWAPYPLGILLIISMNLVRQWPSNKLAARILKILAFLNNKFSYFIPLSFLFLSYYLAFQCIVPTTMIPSQAEYVFWLWSNFFLVTFLGFYCYFCRIIISTKHNDLYQIPCNVWNVRKFWWTLLLYFVFVSSYVLLKVIPPVVSPLSNRLVVVILLLGIHIVVSHICGQYAVGIWTRPFPLHHL